MAETAAAAEDRPPQYPTASCDSCRAPIIWATTRQVRNIPVDAEPVDPVHGGGNILLTAGIDGKPLATVIGKTEMHRLFGKRWVWRSHFATCPHAARHRHPRAHASKRSRS